MSTSIINEYVKIGKESKIWHFCNAYGTEKEPIVLGDNTQIGSYTEIRPGATIGNSCRIQNGCFIAEKTIINNHVFMGPGVKFMVDKFPSTLKIFAKKYELSPITVKEHAVLGGNVIIGPGITIGKCALVGMGSVVTKNVPDYAVVAGNPAKQIGDIREGKYKEKYPEFADL